MRHTRQDVIDRTTREYQRLDRVVKRLQAQDWRRRVPRPESRDPWTVKDALAHITYWKEHSARFIRGERRLPEMRGLEVNQVNAIIYKRWRIRPPAEVVAYHRRTQADVVQTLRQKPAAWFSQREHAPDWPSDFDGHSARHRVDDMEAALPR
jgi:hypothetical protein